MKRRQIPWRDVLRDHERAEIERLDARAAEIDAERRVLTARRRLLQQRATQRALARIKAGLPLDGNDYRYSDPTTPTRTCPA